MCGITGFLDPSLGDHGATVRRMTDALIHRGPDDAGYWVDAASGIALGHRRLSIIDLSPAGHQPMVSASARYVIAFNGEIYNHIGLRDELAAAGHAPAWRGHADTETLLAAIEAWGLPNALRRSVGMFALALWDTKTRSLALARDRIGEKPLYYGRQGRVLLFGSELKALRQHPSFAGAIDRGALASYLRHNYVPDPQCIYQGIGKLPPGTVVTIDSAGELSAPVAYWNAAEAIAGARKNPFVAGDQPAIAALAEVLGDAVQAQMMSDVPLGAFLSGGIDSSTIVALMQERSRTPIKTFTIGFAEASYNEAPHALAVARHLGTDHTELVVSPADAMGVIPRLPTVYDEPFADSSQIPTMLVCALARSQVTVSLSGDAGDELFGGYTRYQWAERVWTSMRRIPGPLRRATAAAIRSRPPQSWSRDFRRFGGLLPSRLRVAHPGDQMHKLAGLLSLRDRAAVYRRLVSHPEAEGLLRTDAGEPTTYLETLMAGASLGAFAEDMMYWDLVTYLPGDILVKVDRAAMAVSLETRVPLLDHRVIEFAWRLPLNLRIRHGEGKWLLRQLLYQKVPKALFERPKMGFGVPIDSWLRGPLRAWADDLLDPAQIASDGFFNPEPVRRRWDEHVSGAQNWAYWLWTVLMFQSWYREQQLNSH